MNNLIKKHNFLMLLTALACMQCNGVDDEIECWTDRDQRLQEEWMWEQGLRAMASAFYDTASDNEPIQKNFTISLCEARQINEEAHCLQEYRDQLEHEIAQMTPKVEWWLCACAIEDRAHAEKGGQIWGMLNQELNGARERCFAIQRPSSREVVEYAKTIVHQKKSMEKSKVSADAYRDFVHSIKKNELLIAPLEALRHGSYRLIVGLQPQIASLGYPSKGLWPKVLFYDNGNPLEDEK